VLAIADELLPGCVSLFGGERQLGEYAGLDPPAFGCAFSGGFFPCFLRRFPPGELLVDTVAGDGVDAICSELGIVEIVHDAEQVTVCGATGHPGRSCDVAVG
jgi:hypothetical protein